MKKKTKVQYHPKNEEIHNPVYIREVEQPRRYHDEVTEWFKKSRDLFLTKYGMVNIVEYLEKEKARINEKKGRKVEIANDFVGEIVLMYA